MSWVAAAIGGSAIVGGAASIFGSSKAADAQKEAAQQASDTQKYFYNQNRADFATYRQVGDDAAKELASRLPFLTSPINMDQATLEATPGYQWNLAQGLKATQNSAAARGLGNSGAALKGAATFATGLADNTYQNQFNNENTNRTNAYNRLKGLVDTGMNASAQTGAAGTSAANQTSAAQIGAGNAQAANWNNIGAQIGKAANDIGGYVAYKGLYGGGIGGGEASPAWSGYNVTGL